MLVVFHNGRKPDNPGSNGTSSPSLSWFFLTAVSLVITLFVSCVLLRIEYTARHAIVISLCLMKTLERRKASVMDSFICIRSLYINTTQAWNTTCVLCVDFFFFPLSCLLCSEKKLRLIRCLCCCCCCF